MEEIRKEKAVKELMRRIQILTNKVAELERRMNNCKCGCCGVRR